MNPTFTEKERRALIENSEAMLNVRPDGGMSFFDIITEGALSGQLEAFLGNVDGVYGNIGIA